MRLAGVWNVPIAMNRATADLAIVSPAVLRHRAYMPERPDYRGHEQRRVVAGA